MSAVNQRTLEQFEVTDLVSNVVTLSLIMLPLHQRGEVVKELLRTVLVKGSGSSKRGCFRGWWHLLKFLNHSRPRKGFKVNSLVL